MNIFVFISGYFLVNGSRSTWLKLFILWLELAVYSVSVPIVFSIAGGDPIEPGDLLTMLTPVTSATWWFATTYIIMLALSPFINRAIHACNERDHLKLIILLLILWCLLPSLANISIGYSNLAWFITLYVIAAYIRLHPNRFGRSSRTYLAMAIGLYAALMSIVLAMGIVVNETGTGDLGNIIQHNKEMNWIFVLLISLFTFLSFSRMNVKPSGFINAVAETTFGVYLIHQTSEVQEAYLKFFDFPSLLESIWFIPYLLLAASIIFCLCAAIDFVRGRIVKRLIQPRAKTVIDGVEERWDRLLDGVLSDSGPE